MQNSNKSSAANWVFIAVKSFPFFIHTFVSVLVVICFNLYLSFGLLVHLVYLFLQIILFIRHLRDFSLDYNTTWCHLALGYVHEIYVHLMLSTMKVYRSIYVHIAVGEPSASICLFVVARRCPNPLKVLLIYYYSGH